MTWQEITRDEYNKRPRFHVGETFTDPTGTRGEPHMLTVWIDKDDQPVSRHQCWPNRTGRGWARPCLYERWVS